jgi:hypothetical protein
MVFVTAWGFAMGSHGMGTTIMRSSGGQLRIIE